MNIHTSCDVVRAQKNVIGVNVENYKGENLGKIEEIILEKLTGETRYLILSFGGILGMGEKCIAIPWNSICYNNERRCFILELDKEQLKNAPAFDKDNWPDMTDPQWTIDIHNFYKINDYDRKK